MAPDFGPAVPHGQRAVGQERRFDVSRIAAVRSHRREQPSATGGWCSSEVGPDGARLHQPDRHRGADPRCPPQVPRLRALDAGRRAGAAAVPAHDRAGGHRAPLLLLPPHPEPEVLDRIGFFRRGAFPDTATRMRFYEEHALRLALDAARGAGIARRGHAPDRDQLHRLLRAGARPPAHGASRARAGRRADAGGLHGLPGGAAGAEAGGAHRALAARGPGADRQPRAVHDPPPGDRRAREHPVVRDLRRRLRREPGERRAGGAADHGLRQHGDPGEQRPDQLAHPARAGS